MKRVLSTAVLVSFFIGSTAEKLLDRLSSDHLQPGRNRS